MIAIVIPYFKLKFFDETLSSLANQSNKYFNVYIGNDASPDNPGGLIDSYKTRLNITYERFEENLGGTSLTGQWDRCIKMINEEEWIMIFGDDDYISSNYVEEFYKNLEHIEKKNIKVVRFASRVVRSPSGELSKLYTHPKIESATDFFYTKFFKQSRGSLSEQIFRREAYAKHGFRDFPLGWGSDNFAWLEFTDFGKIYSINEATAFFRISEENISRGGYKEEVKSQAKYEYFDLIVRNFSHKFRPYQRKKIHLLFELLAYKINQFNFWFWIRMCGIYFREGNFFEPIKMTRRILLLYPKKK